MRDIGAYTEVVVPWVGSFEAAAFECFAGVIASRRRRVRDETDHAVVEPFFTSHCTFFRIMSEIFRRRTVSIFYYRF